MSLSDLQAKRQEILAIAAQHGAGRVRVFGSVARDQADDSSDVDFLVELEDGRGLFDLGGLSVALEDLLGCSVDVVTEQGLRPSLRERVLHDARAL